MVHANYSCPCTLESSAPKNLIIKLYKTISFPGILSGCETYYLTIWEQNRIKVFANKILRRRGIKMGSKVYSEKLQSFNRSAN